MNKVKSQESFDNFISGAKISKFVNDKCVLYVLRIANNPSNM